MKAYPVEGPPYPAAAGTRDERCSTSRAAGPPPRNCHAPRRSPIYPCCSPVRSHPIYLHPTPFIYRHVPKDFDVCPPLKFHFSFSFPLTQIFYTFVLFTRVVVIVPDLPSSAKFYLLRINSTPSIQCEQCIEPNIARIKSSVKVERIFYRGTISFSRNAF